VLVNCGCEAQADKFQAFLCDREVHSEKEVEYILTNLFWDLLCDYVEFDCAFAGSPYAVNSTLALDGVDAHIEGYVRTDDGMPPCTETTAVVGTILGTKECSPTRYSVTIFLDASSPGGLSGSPATSDTGEVMFVFARGTGFDRRFGGALL
jgi:hypothetical protein